MFVCCLLVASCLTCVVVCRVLFAVVCRLFRWLLLYVFGGCVLRVVCCVAVAFLFDVCCGLFVVVCVVCCVLLLMA